MWTQNESEWLEVAAGFARHMIKQSGGFAPYMSAIGADGTRPLMGVDIGKANPELGELLEFAKATLARLIQEQGFVAAAYFYDGRVTDAQGVKSDCLIGHVETADGKCVQYVQTYKAGFLKRAKFGDPVMMPAEPHLWPPAAS